MFPFYWCTHSHVWYLDLGIQLTQEDYCMTVIIRFCAKDENCCCWCEINIYIVQIVISVYSQQWHAPFYWTIQWSSNVSKVALRLRLNWQEDIWTIKLERFLLKGLNQEVNYVESLITAFFRSFSSHLLQLWRKWCYYDVLWCIWLQNLF